LVNIKGLCRHPLPFLSHRHLDGSAALDCACSCCSILSGRRNSGERVKDLDTLAIWGRADGSTSSTSSSRKGREDIAQCSIVLVALARSCQDSVKREHTAEQRLKISLTWRYQRVHEHANAERPPVAVFPSMKQSDRKVDEIRRKQGLSPVDGTSEPFRDRQVLCKRTCIMDVLCRIAAMVVMRRSVRMHQNRGVLHTLFMVCQNHVPVGIPGRATW
jgi:hypothetical protein